MRDILEEMRREVAEKAEKEAAQRVTIEFATRLLASKKLTFEEIAEACGLPLEEVEALAVNQPA